MYTAAALVAKLIMKTHLVVNTVVDTKQETAIGIMSNGMPRNVKCLSVAIKVADRLPDGR
jgi:hypothetical protein